MEFRTVYDITREPAFDIEAVWLSGGFIPTTHKREVTIIHSLEPAVGMFPVLF